MLPLSLQLILGCADVTPAEPLVEVCAAPGEADKQPGDANGDGFADVSDVVYLREHIVRGARRPWCTEQVDLVPDGRIELDDAYSILVHANEGAFSIPGRREVTCPRAQSRELDEECTPLAWGISKAGTNQVQVRLNAPEARVDGWTVAVTSDCTLTAASTAGTLGASVHDTPPGRRDLGYDATFFDDDKATSTVLLGLARPAVATVPRPGAPILALTVDAPSSGCETCTITVGEPQRVLGTRLDSVVSVGGRRFVPPPVTRSLDICTDG